MKPVNHIIPDYFSARFIPNLADFLIFSFNNIKFTSDINSTRWKTKVAVSSGLILSVLQKSQLRCSIHWGPKKTHHPRVIMYIHCYKLSKQEDAAPQQYCFFQGTRREVEK